MKNERDANALYQRPQPRPTPTSEPFWAGLAAQQVRLQQCDDCAGWVTTREVTVRIVCRRT